MTQRIKVGDVEIGLVQNPNVSKNKWTIYRYRERTNEYLSKCNAETRDSAEHLFTQTVEQEELRQKRAAAAALTAIDLTVEPEIYRSHPLYARF